MFRKFREVREERGFTLIELMVVVIILGILAAVAIPLYTGYVRRGKISEGLRGVSDLKTAVSMYYQNHGTFPNATDAATIEERLGISFSVTEAKWTYTVTAGAITATATTFAGADVSGGTIVAEPKEEATTGALYWILTCTDPIKLEDIGIEAGP